MWRRGAIIALLWLAATACSRPASEPAKPSETSPPASRSASAAVSGETPTGSAAVSATPAPAPPPAPPFETADEVDLVIAGGEVIDGTGAPARKADVVVDDGRILHVGAVAASVVRKDEIDASGKVVTPGFIDAHSHAHVDGANSNFLAMGVTTVIVGQDGASANQERIRTLRAKAEHKALRVNVVPLAGHATARMQTKLGGRQGSTAEARERMKTWVAEELRDGAWGISTGLEYVPGTLADAPELRAIAEPVGEVGGIIMSHLRSEDEDVLAAAVDELLAQGETGARVHVAHVKIVYGKGAARAEQLLERLAAARKRGLKVTADIYPYTASYTGIGIVFPDFAKPPHSYATAKSSRRDELASFLRTKVNRRNGPEATLFGTEPFTGKTLAEVAKERGKPFEEVLIDIGPNGASAAYFVMDEELQRRLLIDPHVMISTDGSSGSSHPRGYGAFARVIRKHVVEDGDLSLPAAVHKMSGLPAETMGLEQRGTLAPGQAADILVFDPKNVRDNATYEAPHRLSEGIDELWLNGQHVIANGKLSGRRAGRLLLRPTGG